MATDQEHPPHAHKPVPAHSFPSLGHSVSIIALALASLLSQCRVDHAFRRIDGLETEIAELKARP